MEGLAEELERRIVHLLKSSTISPSRYLEPTSQRLRVACCIDALIALASAPDFLIRSKDIVELHGVITALRGNSEPTTKFICAQAIFHHRAFLSQLPSIQNHPSYRDFRHHSTRADQALSDIDKLREILEDVLKEPETFLRSHQGDISTLLKVYFDTVQSKVSTLNHCVTKMRDILPKRYPLFSWYASPGTPENWRFHRCQYNEEEHMKEFFIEPMAYHILGHLRSHGVYPSIPRMSNDNFTISSVAKQVDETLLFASARNARENLAECDNSEKYCRTFLEFHKREMQPFLSLLGVLGDHWLYDLVWPIQADFLPPVFSSCHLMSLIPQHEGPFGLLAVILDAFIEDQGTIGGLLMLIMVLKYYKGNPPFELLVIDQCLEIICPYITRSDRPTMSKGSQVLFVLSVLEILNWERDAPHTFPFKCSSVDNIISVLCDLSDEIPLRMAERALTRLIRRDIYDFTLSRYTNPTCRQRANALSEATRLARAMEPGQGRRECGFGTITHAGIEMNPA